MAAAAANANIMKPGSQAASNRLKWADAEGSGVGIDADRILRRREISRSGRQRPRSEGWPPRTLSADRMTASPCYLHRQRRDSRRPSGRTSMRRAMAPAGKRSACSQGVEPDGPDTPWQRTAVSEQCVQRVFVGNAPQSECERDEKEQPTSRVARLPGRDERTDEAEAHSNDSNRDVTGGRAGGAVGNDKQNGCDPDGGSQKTQADGQDGSGASMPCHVHAGTPTATTGSDPCSCVPRPGADVTSTSPPRASTRSAMLVRSWCPPASPGRSALTVPLGRFGPPGQLSGASS